MVMTLDSLYPELKLQILTYLDIHELLMFSLVSKQWYEFISSDVVWLERFRLLESKAAPPPPPPPPSQPNIQSKTRNKIMDKPDKPTTPTTLPSMSTVSRTLTPKQLREVRACKFLALHKTKLAFYLNKTTLIYNRLLEIGDVTKMRHMYCDYFISNDELPVESNYYEKGMIEGIETISLADIIQPEEKVAQAYLSSPSRTLLLVEYHTRKYIQEKMILLDLLGRKSPDPSVGVKSPNQAGESIGRSGRLKSLNQPVKNSSVGNKSLSHSVGKKSPGGLKSPSQYVLWTTKLNCLQSFMKLEVTRDYAVLMRNKKTENFQLSFQVYDLESGSKLYEVPFHPDFYDFKEWFFPKHGNILTVLLEQSIFFYDLDDEEELDVTIPWNISSSSPQEDEDRSVRFLDGPGHTLFLLDHPSDLPLTMTLIDYHRNRSALVGTFRMEADSAEYAYGESDGDFGWDRNFRWLTQSGDRTKLYPVW
ncbi:uncharacterized protein LOC103520112 [Diaphorina citri]|uniref:Uncharacterized protein LOC103520112 n=1 Tax=Diaphorina citri TaxID=121845 RepID=A0A3Q0JFB5_DIACI|nr:uncharacterized protein LOC103520112 [Diaphorina citri]